MTKSLHFLIWLHSDVPSFSFTKNEIKAFFSKTRHSYTFVDNRKDFLEHLAQAEVVLCWMFKSDFYAKAPKLQHVFTPAAGKDWIATPPSKEIQVHHSSFHGPLIAESLLAMMLHFNNHIGAHLKNSSEKHWKRSENQHRTLLSSQKALIIGYGNIGHHCATLLQKLGMRVHGIRRTPPPNGVDSKNRCSVSGFDKLHQEMQDSDHCILLLPAEAQGRISTQDLQHLPPHAVLYNFGRGGTITDKDILEALNNGYIKAAGLDVCEAEPPSPDSPLWSHPNILLTPHDSCCYQEYKSFFLEEVFQKIGI
jgi:phosphoglycerate dehydrogenase-like enzyme